MSKSQSECDPNVPGEAFQWMFAAGVPDPRGNGKFANQPLIPPPCFEALSEMLWKMGARFHPEFQELWVKPQRGPASNFQASGVTDVKPEDIESDVVAMAVDQFPDVVERLQSVTPQTRQAELASSAARLMDSLSRLRAASETHGLAHAQQQEGGAV